MGRRAGHRPGTALHFACHNDFTADAGSSIPLTGGVFVPDLLNSAATQRSMSRHRPLVFVNACRSAGVAYTVYGNPASRAAQEPIGLGCGAGS